MMNGSGAGGFLFIIFVIVAFVFLSSEPVDANQYPVPFATFVASEDATPTASSGRGASNSRLIVDRNDDPADLMDCTPENDNDCTLRSAINIANRQQGETFIEFADHMIIKLSSPLPRLTANGITLRAGDTQEVHLDGAALRDHSVLFITGQGIVARGLRIYGAQGAHSQIRITGAAKEVTIANNIIGDDSAPADGCELANQVYGGIFVDANSGDEAGVTAWIHGNIVECNRGVPGHGLSIYADNVFVGVDRSGNAGENERNTFRLNGDVGVFVGDFQGVTVRNGRFHDNGSLPYFFATPGNNVFDNDVSPAQ